MSESYRFKPAPDAKCTCDTKHDLSSRSKVESRPSAPPP